MICILTIIQVFGILAGQVRSLGTILQIFIPSLSLLNAIIIMSVIMMIYSVVGGMVAATNTDKLNVSIMIISVMVITPIIAMMKIGGTHGLALNLSADQKSLTTMGIVPMISTFLYFGLVGMINNENFLRICGAKNAHEAKGATLTAALLIYLPYMIFAGLIGIMGILLIPELGTSDSIIPAMIDKMTGDLTEMCIRDRCISQPAVSQAVRQLEKETGIKLFLRTSKGVQLTKEGELLYRYVKAGVESLLEGEKMVERVLGMDMGLSLIHI